MANMLVMQPMSFEQVRADDDAEREVMHRHRRSTIDEATPVNRRRQPRAMVDADEPTALAAALAQARSVLGPSLLSPAAPTPRPRRPIDEPEPLARPGG